MHKNVISPALVFALLVIFSSGASPQRAQPQGVFGPLKVGHTVTLTDQGGAYEIRLVDVGR
jgi:hypothetical protein